MKKFNPVFAFRDAVTQSNDLQERILESPQDNDFLSLARDCGYECALEDVQAAIDTLKRGGGSLPLHGAGDGTLPLRTYQSLLNLLDSALSTVAQRGDGTWPLKARENVVTVQGWIIGNG